MTRDQTTVEQTTIDLAKSVYADLPKRQKLRGNGFSVSRLVSHKELLRLGARADTILRDVTGRMRREFADGFVSALCGAGPTVVDVQLDCFVDMTGRGQRISLSSPALRVSSYGSPLSEAELAEARLRAMAPPGVTRVVMPAPKPSLWSRFKAFAAEVSKGIPYDGPRGKVDVA